jgi:heparan-alpha-glucosaminide N-acetyltransferase
MQSAQTLERAPGAPATAAAPARYLALDAYRGFIMLVLVSGGFGLAALARQRPAFTGIANQFEHMPWEWITFWDLIQPAFMFMVGVAMPFALARRMELGRHPTPGLRARGGAEFPADADEPDPDVDRQGHDVHSAH